jgi:hypothetical protein
MFLLLIFIIGLFRNNFNVFNFVHKLQFLIYYFFSIWSLFFWFLIFFSMTFWLKFCCFQFHPSIKVYVVFFFQFNPHAFDFFFSFLKFFSFQLNPLMFFCPLIYFHFHPYSFNYNFNFVWLIFLKFYSSTFDLLEIGFRDFFIGLI